MREETGATSSDYAWDDEQRLISQVSGGATTAWSYLPDGRRRQRKQGGTTTEYLWDENTLLWERGAGAAEAFFTRKPEGDHPLLAQQRDGTRRLYFSDLDGAVRLLLTDAGVVTDAYLTDAFGVEQLATGSMGNPYRFGSAYGYYRDAATRLYVRHRHLGTSWGTWLSRDPLDWAGAESYVYGHNNPLEFVDPLGLRAYTAKLCIDDGPKEDVAAILDQLKAGVGYGATSRLTSS